MEIAIIGATQQFLSDYLVILLEDRERESLSEHSQTHLQHGKQLRDGEDASAYFFIHKWDFLWS